MSDADRRVQLEFVVKSGDVRKFFDQMAKESERFRQKWESDLDKIAKAAPRFGGSGGSRGQSEAEKQRKERIKGFEKELDDRKKAEDRDHHRARQRSLERARANKRAAEEEIRDRQRQEALEIRNDRQRMNRILKAGRGIEQLGRSMVLFGVVSEESMEKAVRKLAMFEGAVQGAKGIGNILGPARSGALLRGAGAFTPHALAIGAGVGAITGVAAIFSKDVREGIGLMTGAIESGSERFARLARQLQRQAADVDFRLQMYGLKLQKQMSQANTQASILTFQREVPGVMSSTQIGAMRNAAGSQQRLDEVNFRRATSEFTPTADSRFEDIAAMAEADIAQRLAEKVRRDEEHQRKLGLIHQEIGLREKQIPEERYTYWWDGTKNRRVTHAQKEQLEFGTDDFSKPAKKTGGFLGLGNISPMFEGRERQMHGITGASEMAVKVAGVEKSSLQEIVDLRRQEMQLVERHSANSIDAAKQVRGDIEKQRDAYLQMAQSEKQRTRSAKEQFAMLDPAKQLELANNAARIKRGESLGLGKYGLERSRELTQYGFIEQETHEKLVQREIDKTGHGGLFKAGEDRAKKAEQSAKEAQQKIIDATNSVIDAEVEMTRTLAESTKLVVAAIERLGEAVRKETDKVGSNITLNQRAKDATK